MRMQGEYEFALAALETMFLIEGDNKPNKIIIQKEILV